MSKQMPAQAPHLSPKSENTEKLPRWSVLGVRGRSKFSFFATYLAANMAPKSPEARFF